MRHSGNRRMLFNFKYLSLFKTLYYLFWLLSIEAKNRFDCPFFIEYNNINIEYLYLSDNSNRTNWMSDSGLYDRTNQ